MRKAPVHVGSVGGQTLVLEKFAVTRNIVSEEINMSFPYLTDREKEFVNYDAYTRTFYGSSDVQDDVFVNPAIFQDQPRDRLAGCAEDTESGDGVEYEKPKCSYAELIRSALMSSPDGKLTLSEIYCWIKQNYPFFKKGDSVWQNSIRHNLSLNKSFRKISRESNSVGKGGYWAIDESFVSKKTTRTRGKKSSCTGEELGRGDAAGDTASKKTKKQLDTAPERAISENLHIIASESTSSQYKCKLVVK